MKNFILNNKKIFAVLLFFFCLFLSSGIYLLSTVRSVDKNIKQADTGANTISALEKNKNKFGKIEIGSANVPERNEAKKALDQFMPDGKSAPAASTPIISFDKSTMATSPPAIPLETIDTGPEQVLFIGDKKYEIKMKEGSTVYDLMAGLKERGDFDFKGVGSSGLGFFVEEINGIKNNPGNNTYWLYYINDKPASVGISNYKLMPGDIITWKYEKPEF
jgi:hypothetical protein